MKTIGKQHKCKNAKTQKRKNANAQMQKCKNAKMRKHKNTKTEKTNLHLLFNPNPLQNQAQL